MRIALIGTGTVGRTLAEAFARVGHAVVVGTRDPDRPDVAAWAAESGFTVARVDEAAAHGSVVVNATAGVGSLAALAAAGSDNLAGKVILDVANPLDFTGGSVPTLTIANTDSLAEQIQRAHPQARVVKALNTVNAQIMASPGSLPELHHLPLAGDDADAKATVVRLLEDLGWPRESVVDIGDLSAARGMEAYLLLWVPLYRVLGTTRFNIRLVR